MDRETGRYLSPNTAGVYHHHRSRSVKGRQSLRDTTEDSFVYERKRRNSMPTACKPTLSSSYNDLLKEKENEESLRRVRSFKTTSKGALVNRGDSFKRKTQKERLLINSSTREDNINGGGNNNKVTVTLTDKSFGPCLYRVVMLGPGGVGKTSLTEQFMTSEYIGPTDNTSSKLYLFSFLHKVINFKYNKLQNQGQLWRGIIHIPLCDKVCH